MKKEEAQNFRIDHKSTYVKGHQENLEILILIKA
jgi:hypothetical protein